MSTSEATNGDASPFGAALARERLRAHLTQNGLAQQCGYDHSYISRLEKGQREPSRDTVIQLARQLNVTPERTAWLLQAAGFWPDNLVHVLRMAASVFARRPGTDPITAAICDLLLTALRDKEGDNG